MDRVWKSGAAGVAPEDTEATSAGFPTAGNPASGIAATKPGPYWYHMITESLAQCILGAGLALNKSALTRLKDAIIILGAQGAWSTGDVKLTTKTAADASWVLMNDGTIGNAASGGTTRANADTEALFTHLWTVAADKECPVSGGRGASAAADFAANKTLKLVEAVGRALAIYGAASQAASGVDAGVDITADTLLVPSNDARWITGMPVLFTLTSGTITGLVHNTTYWVIRVDATHVQLASSLANAQNGTAINMTAKAAPVWNIAHSFVARVMGETGGSEKHPMTSVEALSHNHNVTGGGNTGGGTRPQNIADATQTSNNPTDARGGNAAMNNLGPRLYLNAMIKL